MREGEDSLSWEREKERERDISMQEYKYAPKYKNRGRRRRRERERERDFPARHKIVMHIFEVASSETGSFDIGDFCQNPGGRT